MSSVVIKSFCSVEATHGEMMIKKTMADFDKLEKEIKARSREMRNTPFPFELRQSLQGFHRVVP